MKITFGEGLGFAIPIGAVKYFLEHRDAFAYSNDNPSNPYRYLPPPSRSGQPAAARVNPGLSVPVNSGFRFAQTNHEKNSITLPSSPRPFISLARAVTAEVLPAEKLLPDDTILMVTTPDFNKTRDSFQNSPFGKLWNDPAMKDFREKFLSKAKSDYIAPLEHDLGIRFEDYTNLPQGQVTFAITQNTWQSKDGDVGMLFLLDTKDKSSQLKTNLADLKKKWVDSGKTVKSEKIRDIDFSVVILSPGDLAKSPPKAAPAAPDASEPADGPDKKQTKKQLYIGQAESLLIIGNSPKVIEKILVRMSGGSVHTR